MSQEVNGSKGVGVAAIVGMVFAIGLCGGAVALLVMYYDILIGIFGFARFFGVELASFLLVFVVRVTMGGMRQTRQGDTVTFDPREGPMYLSIAIQAGAVGYLYSVFASAPRTTLETWVFLGTVVTLNGLGTLIGVARTFSNRNDHVVLTADSVRWKDNADEGEVRYADIVEVSDDASGLALKVRGEGDTVRALQIPLGEMNFDAVMVSEVAGELRGRLPKREATGTDGGEAAVANLDAPPAG